jgi:hypothetical protein
MGNGFSIGTNLSYDDAFDGRVSADILYRFATPEATKAPVKKAWNAPTIKGLTDGVKERDVRVHDGGIPDNNVTPSGVNYMDGSGGKGGDV